MLWSWFAMGFTAERAERGQYYPISTHQLPTGTYKFDLFSYGFPLQSTDLCNVWKRHEAEGNNDSAGHACNDFFLHGPRCDWSHRVLVRSHNRLDSDSPANRYESSFPQLLCFISTYACGIRTLILCRLCCFTVLLLGAVNFMSP